MCLAQGPQRSDAGEARTRGLSVSSQVLYHWATVLPLENMELFTLLYGNRKYMPSVGSKNVTRKALIFQIVDCSQGIDILLT